MGDDGGHVGVLVSEAMDVLRWAAADKDEVNRVVRKRGLNRTMTFAERAANGEASIAVEADFGRRLGAAAALMLIQNAAEIFESYPMQLPEPIGLLTNTGYLLGAACQLAKHIAAKFPPEGAHLQPVDDELVAFVQLVEPVERVIADKRQNGWWERSFPVITATLRELNGTPEGAVQQESPPGSTAVQQESPPGSTDPGELKEPQAPTELGEPREREGDAPQGKGRRQWVRRLLAVAAAVAVLVAVELFPVIPPVAPRALFGSHDSGSNEPSGPNEPSGRPVVIPTMPAPISVVPTPDTLPNTTVRLFLMSDGSHLVPANQTVNGVLPTVSPPVVPVVSESVTFQVWLSVTDVGTQADQNLRLSIQATLPMVVEKSMLMSDETHEGPSRPELDSVIDPNTFIVSGGGLTKVEPLPRVVGAKVIYQFTVKARPSETNNGYVCGYSAKSVQVNVQIGEDDSRKAVTTPYPLYVARGLNC